MNDQSGVLREEYFEALEKFERMYFGDGDLKDKAAERLAFRNAAEAFYEYGYKVGFVDKQSEMLDVLGCDEARESLAYPFADSNHVKALRKFEYEE